MNKFLRAATASLLMLSTSTWSVVAAAGPITPESALGASESAAVGAQRAQVVSWLQRDDVSAQMTRLGVSPTQAVDRVAALSDEEVQRLAGKIDETPAGGNGVVGAIVFIFIVLLVTDILGLTKIFPFTRSVR